MLTVEVIVPLVGPTHALDSSMVNDFATVSTQLTTTACPFSFTYNGDTYTGSIALSANGLALLVVFATPLDVALPSGVCIVVDCASAGVVVEEEIECPNVPMTVTNDTKLAVVDDEGCHVGYVTMADIITFITAGLNIPTSLCDLTGFPIPTGSLVAQDRVVTTQNGCDLKSVPQSDISC